MTTEVYYNCNYIEKFYIYDIFYNDTGTLVIIMAAEIDPPLIKYNTESFSLVICPHKHTYIYSLKIDYKEIVTLYINNEIYNISVNKYPSFNNEIIMATLVKDEDAYIKQWIKYHSSLGVSRFIIYNNSSNTTLGELLKEYILEKKVILFRWNYPYLLAKSGISGQTTQQNHSIYAFQLSKYIGLLDIDEYVNPQGYASIDILFNTIKNDTSLISSFRLYNKFFYNPNNMPAHDNHFFDIFNCDTINMKSQEKHFVIPKNVKTFSVHEVTLGLPICKIDPSFCYFNHYFFLNKPTRGRNKTNLIDSSIKLHLK
jgi:hypothetical protein